MSSDRDPILDATAMAREAANAATRAMREDPDIDARRMKALMVTLSPKILDGIEDNLIAINKRGDILITNKEWSLYSRQNGGDLTKTGMGNNYLEVCRSSVGEGSEDAKKFGELLEGLLEGRVDRIEMEYECSGPTDERWYMATGVKVDENLFVISHKNITSRKNAELEIEKQKRDLEDAIRSKNLLVSAVSHDIKNTLASTEGILALLRDLATTDDKREMCEIGLNKLQLTDDYLKNLLLFLKSDGYKEADGSPTPPPEPIHLREVSERVIHSHLFDAQSKNIEIITNITDADYLFEIQKTDFTMALSNLLGNAIKYMQPEGRIEIHLLTEEISDGLKTVHLEVTDTGRGIPPEALEKLSQPYIQVFEKDREQGFGLGLSNVRTIASKYDGSLDIQSVLGEGSTFTLQLTLGYQGCVLPVVPIRDRKLSILLIDDDAISRKVASLALKGKEHKVICCRDIQEASDAYSSGSFDVILSDFNLSDDRNAFHLIEELSPSVPVVCYSGDESLPAGYREKGIYSHVVKPASLESLLEALFRALEG